MSTMRLRVALRLLVLVTAVPLAAQQVWDGTWSGTTSQAKSISITVSSNRIPTLSFSGHINGSGCSADFDTNASFSNPPSVSSGGSFSINASSSAPGSVGFTMNGTLGTNGNGSGSLTFNLNSIPGVPSCSGSASASWNVTRQGGPPPAASQDFSVTIQPGSVSLTPGGATQNVVLSATGSNFSGAITVNAPPVSNVTFTPSSFTLFPGGSQSVAVGATSNATATTTNGNFGATATINGNPTSRSVPLSITIQAPAGPTVSGVLVAIGSLPGNFGSFFKTGVQLHNPRSTPISGKLVFHPAGVSGSDSDPFLAYVLDGSQTIEYPDLLPAMGRSGLGSMDLIVVSGAAPIIVARIYNDAGSAGTTGMAIDLLAPSTALAAGDTGIIIAPSDPAKYRLNFGVRTLSAGATMQIIVRDKNGTMRTSVTKSYGPNFFEQVSASGYLGIDLLGSDSIAFTINSGGALIYGASTDNTTQDPSLQYAKKSF